MTGLGFRLPQGGRIDRSRRIRFTFNGKALEGHPGDTLASALLANGVRLIGRSFKYHRPRGVFGLGAEEPGALVQPVHVLRQQRERASLPLRPPLHRREGGVPRVRPARQHHLPAPVVPARHERPAQPRHRRQTRTPSAP